MNGSFNLTASIVAASSSTAKSRGRIGTGNGDLRLSERAVTWEIQIMIYSIIALLIAFWVVGLFMHIGGGFIHTLLALALVVFVFDMLVGRA
jgi:hypothetical protein